MGLDIFFPEDIRNALTALAGANKRALGLARKYGMDREAAKLCQAVYAGALLDVGLSFGLPQTVLAVVLRKQLERGSETILDGAGHPAGSGPQQRKAEIT